MGLAGPLVSFGELRLSTITAQSLPRNPELEKRKAGLFLPPFPPLSMAFTHFLSPSTHFTLLSLLLIVSFPCRPCLVCSLYRLFPRGYFQAGAYSRPRAPERPQHVAQGQTLPVPINPAVGGSLDGEKALDNSGLVFMRHSDGHWCNMKNNITKTRSAGKEVLWALVTLLLLFLMELVPFWWERGASDGACVGLWPPSFTVQ